MSKIKTETTIKIFALIIAIVLWSYVMNIENPLRDTSIRNVPVNILNIGELERNGLVIMDPLDPKINVTVTGYTNNLKNLNRDEIVAQVDLSGYEEGTVRVPVSVDLPSGFTLKDSNPKEIVFNLERIVKKEMRVTIRTKGELSENFILGEITSQPQYIFIEGPRSWVREVDEVIATVDLTGINKDTPLSVPIELLDDNGENVRNIDVSQSHINVLVPVLLTKEVPIDVVTENELGEGLNLMESNLNRETIMIKGRSENLASVTSIKTKPIDLSTITRSTRFDIELDFPAGVTLLDNDESISLEIIVEGHLEKIIEFPVSDIEFTNLNPDLAIVEDDRIIEIVIEGFTSIVSNIEASDLIIIMDLRELDVGIHTLTVEIQEIEGIEFVSISPKEINIELIQIIQEE